MKSAGWFDGLGESGGEDLGRREVMKRLLMLGHEGSDLYLSSVGHEVQRNAVPGPSGLKTRSWGACRGSQGSDRMSCQGE